MAVSAESRANPYGLTGFASKVEKPRHAISLSQGIKMLESSVKVVRVFPYLDGWIQHVSALTQGNVALLVRFLVCNPARRSY
jgi:hypothetical protein